MQIVKQVEDVMNRTVPWPDPAGQTERTATKAACDSMAHRCETRIRKLTEQAHELQTLLAVVNASLDHHIGGVEQWAALSNKAIDETEAKENRSDA